MVGTARIVRSLIYTMNPTPQLPLGTPIPRSQHAVSVSMPTMDDVIGYEEKRPATLEKLTTGYPRFVVHPYLLKIQAHWQRLFEIGTSPVWLTSSENMAKRLQSQFAPEQTKLIKHRGVSGVKLSVDADLNRQAKLFLQHVGGMLGTRQAEDYLLAEGLLSAPQAEATFDGDAEAELRRTLAPLLGVDAESIVLSNSGMNAFFATFEAINAIQRPKGRNSWIKLGWLYVDTMHILEKLSGPQARNEEVFDIFAIDQLERILERRGGEIAGIITEAPTNPLIQTADLRRIHELATRHGAYFVVDPTVNSPANLDVSQVADVIINSLTKYAASEGDVIMGATAVTANCPDRTTLLAEIRSEAERPYPRDCHRLAAQIGSYPEVIDKINRNTAAVVTFLEAHPKVRTVHWALQGRSASHYRTYARSPACVGGLLSFEYDGQLAEVHDRFPLAKGPSFGITKTLLCPFIYLAHYELVTSVAGRERLWSAGISPELLRLSIGTEDPEVIIGALREALD